MKKPVDLLLCAEEHATQQPEQSHEQANDPPVCDTPGSYGDFVQNLAGSIKERNARARHGPRHTQRSKERSKKTLSRVLQGLLEE